MKKANCLISLAFIISVLANGQPAQQFVLKDLYANCNSKMQDGKTQYFAKYIPHVKRDGRNRPCQEELDSIEYSVFSIEKIIENTNSYYVVFVKAKETGRGYCNDSWFDAAIYSSEQNELNKMKIQYKLISFQPFVYQTNRGEVDVKPFKINDSETGFQFYRTFNQMGSSGFGAIYSFSTVGLNELLKYKLFEAHDCMGYDRWKEKYKPKVIQINGDEGSEYYDIVVDAFSEIRGDGEGDTCNLICTHSRFKRIGDSYKLVSESSKSSFSFKRFE